MKEFKFGTINNILRSLSRPLDTPTHAAAALDVDTSFPVLKARYPTKRSTGGEIIRIETELTFLVVCLQFIHLLWHIRVRLVLYVPEPQDRRQNFRNQVLAVRAA
jgi:hypothetical protein